MCKHMCTDLENCIQQHYVESLLHAQAQMSTSTNGTFGRNVIDWKGVTGQSNLRWRVG